MNSSFSSTQKDYGDPRVGEAVVTRNSEKRGMHLLKNSFGIIGMIRSAWIMSIINLSTTCWRSCRLCCNNHMSSTKNKPIPLKCKLCDASTSAHFNKLNRPNPLQHKLYNPQKLIWNPKIHGLFPPPRRHFQGAILNFRDCTSFIAGTNLRINVIQRKWCQCELYEFPIHETRES